MIGVPWTKEQRLRKSSDYRRVQGNGKRWKSSCFMVLFLRGQSQQTRIGLTVSRKIGNSVARNRVKRMLREASRHEYYSILGCWDIVIIPFRRIEQLDPLTLRKLISSVFSHISNQNK